VFTCKHNIDKQPKSPPQVSATGTDYKVFVRKKRWD